MASSIGSRGPLVLFILIVLAVLILIIIIAYRYQKADITTTSASGCQSSAPPTNLRAVSFQLKNIRLTWTASPSAVRYKIFIGSIEGVSEVTSFDDYITTDTELIIENLVLGRTYYMRIKSINACADISTFSEEVSARLGYPPFFRIVSRHQPNLALKIAPNFTDIILAPLCTGGPGDNLCIWSYDETNGYMTSVDSPNVCMRTFQSSITNELRHDVCADLNFVGGRSFGTWNYTPDTGSMCNPQNVDGIACLKISGDNTTIFKTPYDGSNDMQWDIVEYTPP